MPRAWVLLTVFVLFTAACGGDPPDKELQQAQAAIDAAVAAGAELYAASELEAAEAALTRAGTAVAARDYRLALNDALDSRQRAQTAAKLAADGMAAARAEADRSITRAASGVEGMRTRLKSSDVPRLPARIVTAVRASVADADKRVQEARAAFASGDYKAAQTAAGAANAALTTATSNLEAASAAAAKRRR
jgi:hypothetical protein